jgi:microcystin-dependent protein
LDSSQTEFAALAQTGGEKTHTLVTAELPVHAHNAPAGLSFVTFNGTSGTASGTTGGSPLQISTATANAGSGAAHNNLQPYAVVNYIIVY